MARIKIEQVNGYCTLRKKETCDGATCDKAEEY